MTNQTALQATYTALVDSDAKTATAILAPDLVLRITRQGKHRSRDRSQTYVLTVGKPNYVTRRLIAAAKKAGEPFPVRKVQLKFAPVPRSAPRRRAA